MKSKFLAITMIAFLPIACSPPAADDAADTDTGSTVTETGDTMPGTDMPMIDFARVTDDMQGPVFIDPKGPANVAVSGYDPVSYFEGDGVPVKGSKDFGVKYNDFDYYFSSAANAEKFKADPAAFAPQYGGHCAWAMSRGRLASGDPTKYKIVDGKLYLNFNQMVQDTWLTDIPGFIEKADAAWPKVPEDATFDNQ
ncbi:YHS domain-containing (seleno)protein [Parasphingorhabdus halotolerans]|uniref:YHS domain-containing protein n=1 Tax=Parasphingorhabdus halotolerans TaxID=2725558 RepID=A0A6H2DJR0_9SPHN|nr:YHS domain-containing (seleno)protein [Parasphingorhabdus halotolerans]QJB68377.1 YHS domain-containing protein [Parasphingorhabdus halotolerans]